LASIKGPRPPLFSFARFSLCALRAKGAKRTQHTLWCACIARVAFGFVSAVCVTCDRQLSNVGCWHKPFLRVLHSHHEAERTPNGSRVFRPSGRIQQPGKRQPADKTRRAGAPRPRVRLARLNLGTRDPATQSRPAAKARSTWTNDQRRSRAATRRYGGIGAGAWTLTPCFLVSFIVCL